MKTLFRLWALGVVGLYAGASAFGWRLATAPRERIPPSVRSSPGGYRSFHFWHTGYMGGK
jgi:hypothetical protein